MRGFGQGGRPRASSVRLVAFPLRVQEYKRTSIERKRGLDSAKAVTQLSWISVSRQLMMIAPACHDFQYSHGCLLRAGICRPCCDYSLSSGVCISSSASTCESLCCFHAAYIVLLWGNPQMAEQIIFFFPAGSGSFSYAQLPKLKKIAQCSMFRFINVFPCLLTAFVDAKGAKTVEAKIPGFSKPLSRYFFF